jgi:hypothetical protein
LPIPSHHTPSHTMKRHHAIMACMACDGICWRCMACVFRIHCSLNFVKLRQTAIAVINRCYVMSCSGADWTATMVEIWVILDIKMCGICVTTTQACNRPCFLCLPAYRYHMQVHPILRWAAEHVAGYAIEVGRAATPAPRAATLAPAASSCHPPPSKAYTLWCRHSSLKQHCISRPGVQPTP